MAKEIQTQARRCSTHATVEATREVPEMGFPFVVYAIWRAVAPASPRPSAGHAAPRSVPPPGSNRPEACHPPEAR